MDFEKADVHGDDGGALWTFDLLYFARQEGLLNFLFFESKFFAETDNVKYSCFAGANMALLIEYLPLKKVKPFLYESGH
jgi:hypothetical protein